MDTNQQPTLFYLEGETSAGELELFPAVWQASENLSASKEEVRQAALDELLQINAPRFSPLVVYMMVTRLRDPSMSLRARIIESLANVLRVDVDGKLAPTQVRGHLVSSIAQIELDEIKAILSVGVNENEIKPHIEKLLNFCPQAGNFLNQILTDRNTSIALRQIAAYFIGQIGYADSLPTLERIRNRLETRQDVQKGMPFAPFASEDESILLPEITAAITMLQSPG